MFRNLFWKEYLKRKKENEVAMDLIMNTCCKIGERNRARGGCNNFEAIRFVPEAVSQMMVALDKADVIFNMKLVRLSAMKQFIEFNKAKTLLLRNNKVDFHFNLLFLSNKRERNTWVLYLWKTLNDYKHVAYKKYDCPQQFNEFDIDKIVKQIVDYCQIAPIRQE